MESEVNKERDFESKAQFEYENGNYNQCLQFLQNIPESKAVENNRIITQLAIDGDVDSFLSRLKISEDLDLEQQVLIDYNRSLVLAKHKQSYDEAIDLLEARMSVLSEPFGFVDERLTVKLCLLLAIIYIEKKKQPLKALSILHFISEKCNNSFLPTRLQQLKAKCYLQMGSTKAAKRELKSISGEPLLRTYLELQRNNLKKAMKIFNTCNRDSTLYVNNEAIIQYHSGKKNSAVYLLSKIAKEATPEILYNLAIMHLFSGNAKTAFDILYNLVPNFKTNPRLWLRLAECCLEERNKSTINDFDLLKRKQDIVEGYVGEGVYRKLILRGSSSAVSGKDTLLFCRGCLMNALTLLNSSDVNFYPSNPPSETELNKLRISVFLSLSFVNILLCDYFQAYKCAIEALNLQPTGYQKVLTHLYAGEALVWMDDIAEAITHFSPDLISTEVSSNTENSDHPANSNPIWYPNTAKIVIIYNLSVAYTLRGELSKASETLRQVGPSVSSASNAVVPVQVIMLAIYLQLQQGYIDLAKSIIKQHSPQYR
ncbi:CCR4-NOT transcription complex subunit 10-like protein [Dinothrombium tinctorium]|uniref:CCR4-NOT transcription complex subunit 10 n=1 Tax=Dinothrombium tinctorium TaxID=1965070 RepID=A0A3S3P9K9_9ACAR|nr:CCR4-NOT transcription complex subunit 10-like protein [Dinothrombium tinctorium]RWS04491.1 CCR4-NOT transcription complex subunit 10-like protein [Dinothrombium tinctorium]